MTPIDDADHELPVKPDQRLPTDRIAARLALPAGQVAEFATTGNGVCHRPACGETRGTLREKRS